MEISPSYRKFWFQLAGRVARRFRRRRRWCWWRWAEEVDGVLYSLEFHVPADYTVPGGNGKPNEGPPMKRGPSRRTLWVKEGGTVSGMGKITDVNIMSYDDETKKYVIFQVNNWGDIWTALGTLDVDTWTWTSQDTVDGKMMRLRFTVKWTSKDSYDFKNEVGPNTDSMTVMMDGKETRVTAPAAKPAPK